MTSGLALLTLLALCFRLHPPGAAALQARREREQGESGETLAVLVSGQSYRFIYRDMFEMFGNFHDFFGCTVDLYVVLSSETGDQWINGEINTPYAHDVLDDPEAVAMFLKKYGFNKVLIDAMPPSAVDASKAKLQHDVTVLGGGQAWFEGSASIPEFSAKYPSNSQMLYLRNKVYALAKSSESSLPYTYSSFMYVREDGAFQQKPRFDFRKILPDYETPAIEVSQLCGFGGASDKIYFGNRLGFDVLFGEDYQALVNNLVKYVNWLWDYRVINTEWFTEQLMKLNGVEILPTDFGQNDVRYSPNACIPSLYWKCASINTFPQCSDSGGS